VSGKFVALSPEEVHELFKRDLTRRDSPPVAGRRAEVKRALGYALGWHELLEAQAAGLRENPVRSSKPGADGLRPPDLLRAG